VPLTTSLPPLYPILDAGVLPGSRSLREARIRSWIEELLAAGMTLLQYRNKAGSKAELLADASLLRTVAPRDSCTLLLNDFPALAVEVGFDGAHVGQSDATPRQARAMLGPERMLGVSTHNPEQLAAADLGPADYLAIGPVYATHTKLNPDPVVGIEGVRRARALTSKPLVAIGGITVENCRGVLDAGADSVAVISALFGDGASGSPAKIARDFFAKLR
jgi:thiamine-phosphate pyrophosphorylase